MSPNRILPEFGKVSTVHILKDGQLVSSITDFFAVEDRFSWVNKKDIVSRILHLRALTDGSKQSIIAIYEEGRAIREFPNVEHSFLPLAFC